MLLKVADLGLSCFDVGHASGKMIENPRWVAPETLAVGSYTDKSDVYSFGIILNELVTRQLPFHETAFNSAVEAKIKNGERPAMHAATLDKYAKLVVECWAQDPSGRPALSAIVLRLRLVAEACRLQLLKEAARPSPPAVQARAQGAVDDSETGEEDTMDKEQ